MNDSASNFRRLSFDLRDGQMAGIAFGGVNQNPDIVFLHATGFNAYTYRSLLAPLAYSIVPIAPSASRGRRRSCSRNGCDWLMLALTYP